MKIGQVSDVLKTQGAAQLLIPVALLHTAAFALGYWIPRLSFGESTSRTISIECGMQVSTTLLPFLVNSSTHLKSYKRYLPLVQSSALGLLLARKHFTNPLVAVPSAVSVFCMAVSILTLVHLKLLTNCN